MLIVGVHLMINHSAGRPGQQGHRPEDAGQPPHALVFQVTASRPLMHPHGQHGLTLLTAVIASMTTIGAETSVWTIRAMMGVTAFALIRDEDARATMVRRENSPASGPQASLGADLDHAAHLRSR